MKPEVSVIIPAKNSEAWIIEQLQSLNNQIDAPVFEVLVCDNGSTDNTVKIVQEFSSQFDLRVIDASGPQSASYARNIGAEQAQADILLFCDSDDYVNDIWVRELYNAYKLSNGALVSGAIHHNRFNSSAVLDAYGIPDDPESLGDITVVHEAPKYAGYLPTVPGGSFAFGKSDYLALGGMDYSYPGGAEETDFSWRAQEAGHQVVVAPRAVIHYRLKHDTHSIFRQQRIQHRARILLWMRYRGKGMSGPSIKYSVIQSMRSIPLVINPQSRLKGMRILGANIGALEGILKYRILKKRKKASVSI
ncbi:glycosyltransferase family 2 protein [Rothia nasimurium]|uniref:glycosyltransferase family 2 protein n=1 Tax=Rothia nasimurium TaxID=85336 RepID=UPI001628DD27|nr:glycosyltransferase [Rothia nasimurium]